MQAEIDKCQSGRIHRRPHPRWHQLRQEYQAPRVPDRAVEEGRMMTVSVPTYENNIIL